MLTVRVASVSSHYHTKVMIKEANVGGAWEWHQDYGYWYNNGCMLPRMVSAMVALNEHTEANGALHVLKGTAQLADCVVSAAALPRIFLICDGNVVAP